MGGPERELGKADRKLGEFPCTTETLAWSMHARDRAQAPGFRYADVLRAARHAICSNGKSMLPARSDQAVALRRRRIRDPLVARDDPVELARRRVRHRGRLRRAAGAWAGRRHRHRSRSTRRTRASTCRRCSPAFGATAISGLSRSSAFSRTSIPALSTSREPFRAAGIPVAIGGFHVSGCLSMLDGRAVELDACREMGIAMFAGEAEGRLDKVSARCRRGRARARSTTS